MLNVTDVPAQTLLADGVTTMLAGKDWFTVMVNDNGVPVQLFAVGVTVIVAMTGAAPVLVAVNEAMFPVPVAASPIVALLLVQVKVVPATGLPKVIAAAVAPLQ